MESRLAAKQLCAHLTKVRSHGKIWKRQKGVRSHQNTHIERLTEKKR